MRILLVVATELEIKPLLSYYQDCMIGSAIKVNNNWVEVLIGGVGMVATAYKLGEVLANKKFDYALNVGIAGAFNKKLNLGEVVLVENDCLIELGFEEKSSFSPLENLGFGNTKFKTNDQLLKQIIIKNNFKVVNAITVNTVSGRQETIDYRINYCHPDIETMEGAAFFYACEQANLPSVQLRAISNFVEERNTDNWEINLAIQNLNNGIVKILNQLF